MYFLCTIIINRMKKRMKINLWSHLQLPKPTFCLPNLQDQVSAGQSTPWWLQRSCSIINPTSPHSIFQYTYLQPPAEPEWIVYSVLFLRVAKLNRNCLNGAWTLFCAPYRKFQQNHKSQNFIIQSTWRPFFLL